MNRNKITYSKNALGTNQLNQLVSGAADGIALGISLDVTQIADVSDLVGGRAVGLRERVEVRAGRGAAVSIVTELVNMEAPLSVGVVASDVPRDSGGRVSVSLLEGDGALDGRVSTENGN